jgi:hypothetical protein
MQQLENSRGLKTVNAGIDFLNGFFFFTCILFFHYSSKCTFILPDYSAISAGMG